METSGRRQALTNFAILFSRRLILTWALTFIVLLLLFFLFFVLETSDLSRDLGFSDAILKLLLISFPALVAVSIPYSWLIALTWSLWHFSKIGFLGQRKYGRMPFYAPLMIGACISALLCCALAMIPQSTLQKFDTQLVDLLKILEKKPLSIVVKPFEFKYFQDWVFLASGHNLDRESTVRGSVYRISNGAINFVGRGFILSPTPGTLCLNGIRGIEIDLARRTSHSYRANNICMAIDSGEYRDRMESIARIRMLISSPKIPLTSRAIKNGYPFQRELHEIELLSRILLVFSPLILFLFFSYFVFFVRQNFLNAPSKIGLVYFILGISFLLVPFLPEVGWFAKPSLRIYAYYFGAIFICLIILSPIRIGLFPQVIPMLFRKSERGTARRIIDHHALKVKRYYLEKPRFLRLKAQIKYVFLIIRQFFTAFIVFILLIFALLLFHRFLFTFQLNRGITDVGLFLMIQFSDVFYDVVWRSPFLIVSIIPWITSVIMRDRFSLRMRLSGKGNLIFFSCILFAGFTLSLISLLFLEIFGLDMKESSAALHNQFVHEDKTTSSQPGHFIRLPGNQILYYRAMIKKNNEIVTETNMIDDFENSGRIYFAEKAYYSTESVVLPSPSTFLLNDNSTTRIPIAVAHVAIPLSPEIIQHIHNYGWGQMGIINMLKAIKHGIYENSRELLYLKTRLFARIAPFLTSFLLIILLVISLRYRPDFLSSRRVAILTSLAMPTLLQLALYFGLETIIAYS